jgi:hypothetical protein
MTKITIRTQTGIVAWVFLWVRHGQRELSARVHVAGDERARQYGWEVTERTWRFGFGVRAYRDPRFDDLRRQRAAAGSRRRQSQVHTGDIPEDHLAAAARGVSDE